MAKRLNDEEKIEVWLSVATKEQLLALLGKLRLTARIKGVELEPKRVRKSKKAVADGK